MIFNSEHYRLLLTVNPANNKSVNGSGGPRRHRGQRLWPPPRYLNRYVAGISEMIGSAEVNKVIRRFVSPALQDRGFTKVQTRNNWRYLDDRIWVFGIRSIGNTGLPDYFPSQSLHCEIGIYFLDFPAHPRPAIRTKPKSDKDGLLAPKITDCHWRGNLTLIGDQSQLRQGLRHSQERNRKDVWWVNEDGSNVEDVVEDIKQSFVKKGLRRLKNADRSKVLKNWTAGT